MYLRIKNKNLHSPLITMELQGWQIDSVISLGMAFAFLLPLMIPFAWFDRVTPYLDQIITILLSVIMIQTPVRTVITGIRDLMLIPPEEET
ncbi:cation transporter, partial [[Ruminococcus] torques]|uniref:cation transporter n=1 Tax=[Ruminococcus] torques TaxID=33039 RepID=UPI002FE6CA25